MDYDGLPDDCGIAGVSEVGSSSKWLMQEPPRLSYRNKEMLVRQQLSNRNKALLERK